MSSKDHPATHLRCPRSATLLKKISKPRSAEFIDYAEGPLVTKAHIA